MCDFSELKKNKHVYIQPSIPKAVDVCIANNYTSNNQKLQIMKDIKYYIESYLKYIDILRVYMYTNFDVEQLKSIDSLIKNKHLKVSKIKSSCSNYLS